MKCARRSTPHNSYRYRNSMACTGIGHTWMPCRAQTCLSVSMQRSWPKTPVRCFRFDFLIFTRLNFVDILRAWLLSELLIGKWARCLCHFYFFLVISFLSFAAIDGIIAVVFLASSELCVLFFFFFFCGLFTSFMAVGFVRRTSIMVEKMGQLLVSSYTVENNTKPNFRMLHACIHSKWMNPTNEWTRGVEYHNYLQNCCNSFHVRSGIRMVYYWRERISFWIHGLIIEWFFLTSRRAQAIRWIQNNTKIL